MTSHKYDVIYKTVMEDIAFTLTCYEQVTCIKIEARRGKSVIEIKKALEEIEIKKVLEEVGSVFVFTYSSITR